MLRDFRYPACFAKASRRRRSGGAGRSGCGSDSGLSFRGHLRLRHSPCRNWPRRLISIFVYSNQKKTRWLRGASIVRRRRPTMCAGVLKFRSCPSGLCVQNGDIYFASRKAELALRHQEDGSFPRPCRNDKVERIVEAARLAPTSSGLQPFECSSSQIPRYVPRSGKSPGIRRRSPMARIFSYFAAWDNYTAERINEMFDLVNEERNFTKRGWGKTIARCC